MVRGVFHIIAFSAILLGASCTYARNAPIPFAAVELGLNGALPGDTDFDRPFETQLPAMLSDAHGKRLVQLSNCRDYLAVRDRIVGSDTDADYRVLRLQTVPCEVLALLKSATPAAHTALPADFQRLTDASIYPASIWPAVSDDERRELTKKGATLRTASGKNRLSPGNGGVLELESSGMGMHLTLLARGDFNHDGWEDAAFRWEAYALKGSYTDARLVVLTRKGSKRSLYELDVNLLLSEHKSDNDENLFGVLFRCEAPRRLYR